VHTTTAPTNDAPVLSPHLTGPFDHSRLGRCRVVSQLPALILIQHTSSRTPKASGKLPIPGNQTQGSDGG
jgi:hypothetical protein